MGKRHGNNSKQRSGRGKTTLAGGLLCAIPAFASAAHPGLGSPIDLMPEVFTRFEYIDSTHNRIHRQNTTDHSGTQNSEHPAQEEIDLALENFFYALEDLIQSAAAQQDTERTDAYAAQVQFPAQVMSGFQKAAMRTDQASHTASANAAGTAELPQGRARTERDTTGSSGSMFGDFKYTTTLSVDLEHNDNIYTTRTNQREDQIARTHINGVAESRSRKRALKFEGDIDAGHYNQNADNNYADWSTTASYSTLLSQRSKAFAGIGYFYHHEDKGEGSTQGDQALLIDQPIEFESWVARGIYEIGTKQSRTRLVADGKIDQLRTTNFQDVPAIVGRDRNINSLVGTAYYSWTQRLSYLFEVRHMDIEYVDPFGTISLDSTQRRYALGAEWLATRKTAGSIRLGWQEKDYDNLGQADNARLSWEAVIEWAPRPRTEMIFETLQDTEESDGFGAARDRTDVKLTWKQKWSPRVDTSTSLQHGITDFQQTDREDNLNLVDAELRYSLTPSAAASLKLTYVDNSSNVAEYGFERSQIQLGLDMEL